MVKSSRQVAKLTWTSQRDTQIWSQLATKHFNLTPLCLKDTTYHSTLSNLKGYPIVFVDILVTPHSLFLTLSNVKLWIFKLRTEKMLNSNHHSGQRRKRWKREVHKDILGMVAIHWKSIIMSGPQRPQPHYCTSS